ncbi:Bug family tripartite tricarboxylate transporter substrate binding protein [Cupriavidus consociatus]|uniref:Bug family tripartite tricarboxylate transporter substrate binding protein n=1 Tax=Cupriavidus consociatus TaxID=2821357 RepID=UPI001AE5C693|nr:MULTISPECIES: tripartite tricarboxylate transporter substrate binding protein [unclassified Cupriavidus]MBP0625052.1 tripartite tricarboxylate transporter substrate binding protein [Cupriavidus sp. LEh25]MDK2661786.1 tripartite tricarboxylate transporter substrate binding protein [Cupriavidus sp. LEh21]
MKTLPQVAAAVIAISTLLSSFSAVAAEAYPSRPVELVVAFQPGGGTDSMARAFAEASRKHFSQPITVINKPGASGSIGLAYAASSNDGYRVAMVFAELLTLPLLNIGKVSYEDFQPIAQFSSDPTSITVRADAPWNTVEQFIAYAKANPGKISVSNAGNGSIGHVAAAALAKKIDASFNHVPYQGNAPAILGLLGGQVEATTVPYAELRQYVSSGKLKTLAVMSDKRLPEIPQVPTLKEKSVDLSVGVWRGIAVSKSTPPEIVGKLRALAADVAKEPSMQEAVKNLHMTLAYVDAPEFKTNMTKESEQFKRILPSLALKQ